MCADVGNDKFAIESVLCKKGRIPRPGSEHLQVSPVRDEGDIVGAFSPLLDMPLEGTADADNMICLAVHERFKPAKRSDDPRMAESPHRDDGIRPQVPHLENPGH